MSNCDVCNNFALLEKATCDEKAYRWSVIKSLCHIIELLNVEEDELPPTTNILPQVVKTFTQVEAGYTAFATIGLINSTKQLNSIRVVNGTNIPLDFSYDGGASTAFTVPAGATYTESLNIILSTTTSLQMKKTSGTAISGSVYIEGRYDT